MDIAKVWQKAIGAEKGGDYSEAIERYLQVLDSHPSSDIVEAVTQHMADCMLQNYQAVEAEVILKDGLKEFDTNADYHYLLGCALTYQEKIDEAITSLNVAVSLHKNHSKAWGQLGWIVGYNKDWEKGIVLLKKSLQIDSNNDSAFRDLCMLYVQKNDFKTAALCIDEALERNPSDPFVIEIQQQVEKFREHFEQYGTE